MKKILIVDDQLEVRELVDVTLRTSGLTILKASSGEEALATARKEKPDLIIMDIMMPGKINGLEATRILKQPEFTLTIDLNAGGGKASVFTCDFSIDYVKINADYRS